MIFMKGEQQAKFNKPNVSHFKISTNELFVGITYWGEMDEMNFTGTDWYERSQLSEIRVQFLEGDK